MNKIIIGTFVAGMIAVSGYAIASNVEDTCGYDPVTGDFWDGKQWSAYGGWDDSVACAKQGKLPKVVADRFGVWGDKVTQIEGRKWVAIDAKIKAERAAAEAAASAEKAKAAVK